MSYSDSSQLLNKQAELKTIQTKYDEYVKKYTAVASATPSPTTPNNKNAISTTNPPPGIRPDEDFGDYWKHVSTDMADAAACWTSASRDPRVFKKVVYTGTANTDAAWNKQCYGLTWDAPAESSYTTAAPGYSTMVGSSSSGMGRDYYTKLGITSTTDLSEATQIADLKTRMDSLTEEIGVIAGSSINSELSALSKTSGDQKTIIQNINQYMNSSAQQIDARNNIIDKRKNMNNIYEDINKQITLNSRKYKFVIYFLIGLVVILSYMSYVSKFTIIEQIASLSNLITLGWWSNWGVITFVISLMVLSSFGWDMKGNIAMVWRYISDPEFWMGQMWWVGVSFLFLIVIFFYATFTPLKI